jgi:hypothetical protein
MSFSVEDMGERVMVAEEIRKLADLHEQGVLTDEEFSKQKQLLLDGSPAPVQYAPPPAPAPAPSKLSGGMIALIAVVCIVGWFIYSMVSTKIVLNEAARETDRIMERSFEESNRIMDRAMERAEGQQRELMRKFNNR